MDSISFSGNRKAKNVHTFVVPRSAYIAIKKHRKCNEVSNMDKWSYQH